MKKEGWLKRAVGEISKLRQGALPGWRMITGSIGSTYKLDSTRVDYKLARGLYDNSNDDYKLGAGFAKPVINTCVGFMGVPAFKCEDDNAQEILDDFFSDNVSKMQQTHRDALRDGDCWVWVTRERNSDSDLLYPESDGIRLVYNIIPPEQVYKIKRDWLTGVPIEYVLKSTHEWSDDAGNKKKATVTQRINTQKRVIEVAGDMPEGLEPGEADNPWGFIPIVQFSNERDTSAANGKSDLEAIEPFLKAYHDVMKHAIQGSKMHSTPRLKIKLKDVSRFLKDNFGIDDPKKFSQDGKTINLDGHELLILASDDEAQFVEVNSAIGSAEALLKFLFYNIVDTSETPEFAFGVHMSSSHASVKEQMPVLIRRVGRKREHFLESWQMLARIVLAMTSKSKGVRFSTHQTVLMWDEIDARDEKEIADSLNSFVAALSQAIEHALISQEAAVKFLSGYVKTMNDWVGDNPEVPGEREKIIRDRILMRRLEDGEVMDRERKLIDEALKDLK